ncbi:hypothetical protein GCM10022197_19090 [Microlunatus spumicola]|uniref:Peptidase S9 prolyl oligopeptidase catalytic domain-containing protein n=1 Tax=Microlunatus spumicola TaxID=81499 RepID=A0ABP6XDZ1_9ACTN
MSLPGPDRLVAGPQVGRGHRGRRRLARALLVGASSALVLLVVSLATAPGWRPPAELPPLDVAPHPAVEPVDRHLPYAAVDRSSTTTANGARARVVRPRGAEGTIPGIVLVAGSGATTREDLADEAEALARGGLAVLTYDKRRGSSVLRPGYAGLADDALAALDVVARQPGVDPERVGLLGYSEGGWVVPLAAQRAPGRVAFTVLLSAPVVSPLDQASWTLDRRLAAAPLRVRAAVGSGLAMGRPLLGHLGIDVRPALAAMPQPTYAVWGADDPTVPVRVAVGRFREATGERGRVEVVGGAGHRVPVASGWAERVSDWVRRGYPPDAVVRGAQPVATEGLPTLPGVGFRTDPRPQLAVAGLAALVAGLWPLRQPAPRTVRTSRRG